MCKQRRSVAQHAAQESKLHWVVCCLRMPRYQLRDVSGAGSSRQGLTCSTERQSVVLSLGFDDPAPHLFSRVCGPPCSDLTMKRSSEGT